MDRNPLDSDKVNDTDIQFTKLLLTLIWVGTGACGVAEFEGACSRLAPRGFWALALTITV